MSIGTVLAWIFFIFIALPFLAYVLGRMAGKGWFRSKYEGITKFIKGGNYGRKKKSR